jgi:hypothetical protein
MKGKVVLEAGRRQSVAVTEYGASAPPGGGDVEKAGVGRLLGHLKEVFLDDSSIGKGGGYPSRARLKN